MGGAAGGCETWEDFAFGGWGGPLTPQDARRHRAATRSVTRGDTFTVIPLPF